MGFTRPAAPAYFFPSLRFVCANSDPLEFGIRICQDSNTNKTVTKG